jgi:hypothetical protein
LQRKRHPIEKLEEVIEEIRRMMLRSAQETTNKENLRRRNIETIAG